MQRVPPRVLSLPRWHGASRAAGPGTAVTGAVPAAAAAGRAARANHGGEELKAKRWASTVAAGRARCRPSRAESGVYLQESQILQEMDLFTRKQSWAVAGRVELLLCAGTALCRGRPWPLALPPVPGDPGTATLTPAPAGKTRGTGISLAPTGPCLRQHPLPAAGGSGTRGRGLSHRGDLGLCR